MIKTAIFDGIEYELVPIIKKEEKIEYKAGDWIIFNLENTEVIRRILSDDEYNSKLNNYDKYGDWVTLGVSVQFVKIIIRKATNEEIKEHLIQLAKSKGFKNNVNVTSLNNNNWVIINDHKYIYCDNTDLLLIDDIAIYRNGTWAKIIPQEKIFTFGGHTVKIDTFNRNITCKEEVGTFNQLQDIINKPLKKLPFGKVFVKNLLLHQNVYNLLNLDDNDTVNCKNLINQITIGCLTGTYQELLNIYNHILELDNNKK